MGVKGLLSHVLAKAREEDAAAKAAGQGESGGVCVCVMDCASSRIYPPSMLCL